MTALIATLLIDGHDIRTAFPGLRVVSTMNLYAPGGRKGEDQDIAGADGVVPVPGLPLDKYAFSFWVQAEGASPGAKEALIRSVASVMNGANHDSLVTLTRKLINVTNDGYDQCYCNGRFSTGLAFDTLNPATGKSEFQFTNLNGYWRRSTDNAKVLP